MFPYMCVYVYIYVGLTSLSNIQCNNGTIKCKLKTNNIISYAKIYILNLKISFFQRCNPNAPEERDESLKDVTLIKAPNRQITNISQNHKESVLNISITQKRHLMVARE